MRIRIKNSLIVLMAPLLLSQCVEEYIPDISDYESLLVVDGLLTNEQGPVEVMLSMSSKVDEAEFIPLPNCEVSIVDNTGESVILQEISEGIYSSDSSFQGVIGKSYKIVINTPSGKSYSSDFANLQQPVGIADVSHELESRKSENHDYDLWGYQFYVNTEEFNSDSTYLLWKCEETYEYTADFTIDYYYAGIIYPSNDFDSLYTCWRTEKIGEVFHYSSMGYSGNQLQSYPLHYVDTETRKLTTRYSLMTEQLTIDAECHAFWEKVHTIISQNNNLYATQPFQIRGNIKNTQDEYEPVLGYFTVAGKDTSRIFVERPYGVQFNFSRCSATTDLRGLGFMGSSSWPIYLTVTPSGALGLAGKGCFDCRSKGGQLEKPDFW